MRLRRVARPVNTLDGLVGIAESPESLRSGRPVGLGLGHGHQPGPRLRQQPGGLHPHRRPQRFADRDRGTCTGATLAQGGTCSVRFEYESKCYYKVGLADIFRVSITSSQFTPYTETVNGTNLSYSCD